MKRVGKSLTAWALALVMSLTLLPVQAMAAEVTTEEAVEAVVEETAEEAVEAVAEETAEETVEETAEETVEETAEAAAEVAAEVAVVVDSGTCGESVTWSLSDDGTMTIGGTGAMNDYLPFRTPWHDLCSQVKTVVVEDGVTSVGDYAFEQCKALTSVTIPDSVTSIGDYAFIHSNTYFDVSQENSTYCSVEGALYNKQKTTFFYPGRIEGSNSFRIPNSVTAIARDAFNGCKSLTSITIPDSVTSIGAYAFSGCLSLKDITIPAGVTSIGEGAFQHCESLTSVAIPEGVTSIENITFSCCESLTSVTIPDGVTIIDELAFRGCSSLTGLVIPDSVTRIEGSAFSGCTSLTSVTIPDSVTSIGSGAFSGSNAAVNVMPGNSVYCSVAGALYDKSKTILYHPGTIKDGTFRIPGSVTTIEEDAFSDCTSLTSVAIPKNVTCIKWGAFFCCNALTAVYYGGSEADWEKITIEARNESLQNATRHTGVLFEPADVQLIDAKANADSITVTWEAADGAVKYRVYRKDAANPNWTALTSSATGTSYVDKTAVAGVKYTYTVRGINGDGVLSSGYDKTGVSATIPKPAPTPITPADVKLVGAKAVSGGIQVTWQKAANAKTYRVYRKAEGATKWSIIAHTTDTSYVDKTVQPGVKYAYTVRGIAEDGKTLSSSYEAGVSATAAPATVTLGSAKVVNGGIQVTWQKAAGAAKYRVYRKDAANPNWTALTSSATGTSYVDKTAKAGVKYTYTVRGIAADGKTLSSGYDGNGVSAMIPKSAAPANVKLVSAKVVNGGIQVAWKSAAGAAKYRVYRKAAGETKWTALTSSATGTSYVDKTAKADVKYTYTVRGIAKDGETLSPGYDETGVSAIIYKPAKVSMVGIKQITKGTRGVQLTWKPAANARTYNVYRAVNPPAGDVPASAWKLVGKKVDALSFKDTTGQSGKLYAYTVRGVAADGKTLSPTYNKFGLRITMP